MAKKKDEVKITADHIKAAIKNKFSDTQRYGVLTEVNSGTGYLGMTWIDALVISLWPSDGMHRMAFEVKVSRADFLSEMKKHSKNEFFREHCHEFWYATAKGVVKSEDEIPEGCGWMCMRGDSQLVIKKQAQRKVDVLLDDTFVASITRSCLNAEGAQRTNLIADLRKGREYKELYATQKAVESFIKKRGERHWYASDKTAEEIEKELDEATMEKEHKVSAEQVEGAMNNIRQKFSLFLMDMLQMSKHLLTDVDEHGSFILGRYSNRDEEENMPMLTDLIKKIKKRGQSYSFNKKNAKAEVAFFQEFLKKEMDKNDN